MPEPVMTQRTIRMPKGLIKLATERVQQEQPDVKIDGFPGVVRYALALLIGIPREEAARELVRGHRKEDPYG